MRKSCGSKLMPITAAGKLKKSPSPKLVDKIFKALDSSNDGLVDKDEFMAFYDKAWDNRATLFKAYLDEGEADSGGNASEPPSEKPGRPGVDIALTVNEKAPFICPHCYFEFPCRKVDLLELPIEMAELKPGPWAQ